MRKGRTLVVRLHILQKERMLLVRFLRKKEGKGTEKARNEAFG
jgi:hypothetical protein